MRKVTKDFEIAPMTLTTDSCKRRVKISLVEKGKHKFSSSYYASEAIRTSLSKIYNNKCAFCENDTTAGASLQVEHYRPKAKVTEVKNHSGYYWLGYVWSNLLYACSKCNRSKANFFPLKSSGKRVESPSLVASGELDYEKSKSDYKDYLDENPLIINPEITDPREHIKFLSDGEIMGTTEEGRETIAKCKLFRKPLTIARKKLIEDTLHELKKVVFAFNEGEVENSLVKYVVKNEILKLLKIYNENRSFSELARTALINFEVYFIERFGVQKDQDLLRNCLKEIK